MLTKFEVRAVALSRLAPRLGVLVWDVGAGSGSVAVECARFDAAVVALERDPDEIARIGRNARTHGVTVRAVLGEAPAALEGLPDPDSVFIGGGGPAVVAACAARGPARIVVALAAVERIGPAAEALTQAGYAADGVLVHASRLAALPGGAHRLAATNPVALVWGVRAVIGLIAVTAAGRAAAGRLSAAWPEARCYDGPAAVAVPLAWHECDALVCFLAAGATVRLIAPLLESKATDPAVVAVDEATRWAVPLLGGHARDANDLARRVAEMLGAEPVVTTATDARGVPGLDTLGWPVRAPSRQ